MRIRHRIRQYFGEKGVDFYKFTEFAFGDAGHNFPLDEVPKHWNKLHPQVQISGCDSIYESLQKMIELYLTENQGK